MKDNVIVGLKRIRVDGILPEIPHRYTKGAVCYDIKAVLKDPIVLRPMDRAIVPTGICLEIPKGYEGLLRPRSGLAWEYGITVLNSPATIDYDYRGEIKVILINLGEGVFSVHNGDRIAQLAIRRVETVKFVIKRRLPSTNRGDKGFGSTGY